MKSAQPSKIIARAITLLAIAMGIYHLVSTQYLVHSPIEHQNTHLTFALLLVFLSTLRKNRKFWPLILLLILLTLISTGYVKIFYDALEARLGVPNTTDIVIGIILLIVVFEGTRQAYGPILPIVALIFLGYVFLGQNLPGPLWHFPISLKAIIANFNMGLTGMYGLALAVSTNYIFLFVLFGGLIKASGATGFFMELGKLAGRRLAGGAGMIAVVSSGLVGTTTGIGGANVAITGTFTIPLMKRVGYKPEQAGAIEAVASTGTAIMPPIMGVAAFLLADFLGLPYIYICAMAVIPAILYYLCVALFVQLSAMRLKISPVVDKVDRRAILVAGPQFLIPLVTLTALLVSGRSPMYAAFWAIVAIIVISLIRKETRGSFKTWVQGFTEGAMVGAQIGITCALIGVMIATITMTGVGVRFPAMVEGWSAGNVVIALALVALMTIILGCGLPPMAAYVLVALMTAPALVQMGIPLISAHFFVFFLAVFALITPPVGLAVLVAAPLAGANYWKVCIESVKVGIVAWFLPFLVIGAPIIILQPQEPMLAVTTLIASFTTVLMLQVGLVGHYFTELNVFERAMAWLSATALITFIFTQDYMLLAIGLFLCVLITIWQIRKRRALKLSS